MARSECFWARGSFWIGFFRSRTFMQKKVMQAELGELSFGVVGPLNYFKRGPQSPKAKGPRAKAKSPKSKGTIERGTDHAHGLGSPVADIYIYILLPTG